MTTWTMTFSGDEDDDDDDEESGSVPPRPSPVYAFTPVKRLFVTASRRFTANSSSRVEKSRDSIGWRAGGKEQRSKAEKEEQRSREEQ